MGNNLSVKVTADIVDLQTKFSVAKAEVSGLTSELNKLAKESAKGTIDASGQQRLQQLAGDLIHARSEVGQYAGKLREAGVAVGGFTGKLAEGHGALSTATREFRALFDELTSGRTQNTPGTLAIIAQRVLGLGPAALGAVAGVGALAAGLGYLALRSIEASHALDQMHTGALRAGNDIPRAQFEVLVQTIGTLPGVSEDAARKIVSALAGIPGMTFDSISASARLAAEEMRRSGGEADKVAQEFAKAFDPARSAVDVAKSIGGLTQAQVDEAIAADRSQNAHAVLAEKIALLSGQLGRARGVNDEYTHSLGQTVMHALAWLGLSREGMTASEITAALKKEETDSWKKNADAIDQAAGALRRLPAEKPLVFDQGSVVERMREQMGQLAATWDGTQSGLLTKQRAIATQTLAEAQKNSKDYLAIQQEIARLDVQVRQTAGAEIIANARTQLATLSGDTSRSATQRLEAERDTWQQILAGERLTAAQRVDVQRSLNQSIAELNRAREAEAKAIARSDVDTDIAIARDRIEAQKAALEIEVQANRIAAVQKAAILKDLTNQEYALNIQALQSQLETLKTQPVEYERVYNQIRELKAKQALDLANIDRQAAAETARQAREQVNAWRGAMEEIERAEDRMVADLIGGRTTLNQSLLRLAQDLITREIQNDLKAMTTRILMARTEEGAKKAIAQGGFIYHILAERQKTAATVTSESARTTATAAGEAARLSAKTAAAATEAATSKAVGAKTVMQDAAKAFSGTYASVAQIPYVGWILAPIAASGAFAAVAAYEGLASLDVGAWNVPHDMVAQIHKGETVVPTTFAEGLRQSAGGAAGPGAGGGASGGRAPVIRTIAAGRNHVLIEKRDLARAIKQLNSRFALS